MLARSFLTAEKLDIPQKWLDALIKTLDVMERGEFVHTPKPDLTIMRELSRQAIERDPDNWDGLPQGDSRLFLGRFNMAHWSLSADCGTVCCIGGAAEIIGKVNFWAFDEDRIPKDLENLFYPEDDEGGWIADYDTITVEEATQALRNYLTLGKAHWVEILKG